MLKVTLEIRKTGKIGWYCNISQICSKTIKNYSLATQCVTVKEKGGK